MVFSVSWPGSDSKSARTSQVELTFLERVQGRWSLGNEFGGKLHGFGLIVSLRRLFANTPKRTPFDDDHHPEAKASVQTPPPVFFFLPLHPSRFLIFRF
jgi:hypothetical protein